MTKLPTFVTFEDRSDALVGVKLLALSLDRSLPAATLILFTALETSELLSWASSTLDNVELRIVEFGESKCSGWSVKAEVLLRGLEMTESPVCWLDSDLIALKDFTIIFDGLDENEILLATQKGVYDAERTKVWNLGRGKPLASSINSCVFRVTRYHKELLEKWHQLLVSDQFQNEQRKPHSLRRKVLYSDQDVLEGLLNAHIPEILQETVVKFISSGEVIVHDSDFGWRQRLFSNPDTFTFVHAQGLKPWSLMRRTKKRLRDICLELSPYVHFARKYADDLGADSTVGWLKDMTKTAKLSCLITGNHPFKKSVPVLLLTGVINFLNR